ncbi:MAG: ABC transporter ATP-binding protein [Armatimonadota bacterium]|nr:ABC transporter ATP-binding protein [Armatimonadota bacterium]MDR7484731.1 ABC transporter ATP-binding protein [Armatimonadota bacterium]MDR7531846.1 ABC transporter ATP-binding protein [Armatimonadota bacterium]MDR7534809.1 ABC transporter ATP-binding protein [Armatimonadota bacterium]
MLKVEQLHAYYGDSHILQGVTLAVGQGQVVGLLGRNGAGKTTTIRSIIGELRPRRGRVVLFEHDVTGAPPERIARLGVGLVPQGRAIFPTLTVRENLLLAARPGPWTEDRVYDLFPNLRLRRHHRGAQLSGGEQQMLAIGRALLTNPRLLLLDEPSEGLAPLLVREIGHVIQRLRAAGLAILLVEQNLPMALRVADWLYVLNKGQIVYQAPPAQLRADEHVKHTFLGV